jgi:molybdenum cofactor guanylyltransferase
MGGADKALLPLGQATLIRQVMARFAPQVAQMAISANGDTARFGPGQVVLPDPVPPGPVGPLAGLLAGLRWAGQGGATYLATCAVDVPHLPCDLVAQLYLALPAGGQVALAQAGGRVHGTCGLWQVTLAGELAAFLASGAKPKVQDFAQSCGAVLAPFPQAADFDNINTPADLARLQAAMGAGA